MDILTAALEYEFLGFSIIPCDQIKTPKIRWLPYQKKAAAEKEIKEWWGKWPDANVGIVTGPISGIYVIDIDSPEGKEAIKPFISDSPVPPTVNTPKGGQHLYYKYPEIDLGNTTRLIKDCDSRGFGGYVMAPPSIGENGRVYSWEKGLSLNDMSLPDLPKQYVSYIKNYNKYYIRECVTGGARAENEKDKTATASNIFEPGTRDKNLHTIARSLAKDNKSKDYILQVLLAIMKSWGEYDEKWANDKIKSVFKWLEEKREHLGEEIRGWVLQQTGNFTATSCYNEQHLQQKSEKSLARMVFSRMCDAEIIEPVGIRSGEYRLRDKKVEEIIIDGLPEEGMRYNIWLPFELHTLVDLSEGNIILIAGEYQAGKTAWLLNILKKNKGNLRIRYMSSEMWKKEFIKRFRGFTDVPPKFFYSDEKTQYIHRSSNYVDALLPGSLNIIDYLEIDDYSKTAEILKNIHDKMKGGICVIAVQKKKGEMLGRGKDMLMEKPRLAVSLFNEGEKYWAVITKAKICIGGNHDGKRLDYEIKNGCQFKNPTGWNRPDKEGFKNESNKNYRSW